MNNWIIIILLTSLMGCQSDVVNRYKQIGLIEKGKLSLYLANCGKEIYFAYQDSMYTKLSEFCMIQMVDSTSLNDTIWTYFEYKDPLNLVSRPNAHYTVIYLKGSDLPCIVDDLIYVDEHKFSCEEYFNPLEFELCINDFLKLKASLNSELRSILKNSIK